VIAFWRAAIGTGASALRILCAAFVPAREVHGPERRNQLRAVVIARAAGVGALIRNRAARGGNVGFDPTRVGGWTSKGNAGPVNPCPPWTLGRFGYRFVPWTTKQGRGCVVNFRIILLAATTMLLGDVAMAQPAVTPATSTVTPVLSGTYIVRVTHVCQVLIDVTQTTPKPVAAGRA
jgi:hypothetical protein